jgi:response regulator RpfG family c-di-GMP phosphodiesterase
MTDEEAKRYMSEWAGLEFDPKVVKAFLAIDPAVYVTSPAPEKAPTDEERKYRFS